jgi:hypothetical protein
MGRDHVDISPERDTLPQSPVSGPRGETSWRDTPPCTMTLLSWVLLVGILISLGLLMGWFWWFWTNRTLQPKLRQQAEERRRLNEEWAALRAAHRQQGQELADDDLHGGVAVGDSSDSPVLSSAKKASGPVSPGTSGPSSGSFQRSQKSGTSWSSVAQEQGPNRDSLVQEALSITIYLSDESAHEQVEAAVEDLLVATGGHIEHRDDPILGSWFRGMRAKVSRFVDSPLGHEMKNLAAHAAESRLVHAQDATVTATMLQNLGPVLVALQPTKEAVIRAGALLIVKMDSTLVVHQLTSAQQLQLDHQPQLAQSPHDILSALELRSSSSAQSVDGVDGTQGSATALRPLNGNPTPPRIVSNGGQASASGNVADQQSFPETSAGA